MKLPTSVISWIFDYLTNRLQSVRLNELLSSLFVQTLAHLKAQFSALSVPTVYS